MRDANSGRCNYSAMRYCKQVALIKYFHLYPMIIISSSVLILYKKDKGNILAQFYFLICIMLITLMDNFY